MIVRTYGRRNRSITTRSYSDSAFKDDNDVVSEEDYSLSQESPQEIHNVTFSSSQDSTAHFSFDSSQPYGSVPSNHNSTRELPEFTILPSTKPANRENFDNGGGVFRKPKKSKIGKIVSIGPTATLMETQEYGEMMEHVDEVNFAMDGLRKGQPVRIRRASLLSLLSICGTPQQRRLLRAHGMAKTIIDAVLGLSFDDSPSNLAAAAAALFYILTSDGARIYRQYCCD